MKEETPVFVHVYDVKDLLIVGIFSSVYNFYFDLSPFPSALYQLIKIRLEQRSES